MFGFKLLRTSEVALYGSLKGTEADLFVNRLISDKDRYGISIVKSKYSNKLSLQLQDLILLKKSDMEKLCNWILDVSEGTGIFSQEQSLIVPCSCTAEYFIGVADTENNIIYLEILDNQWLRRNRKFSYLIDFDIPSGKEFAKSLKKRLGNIC